MATSRYGLSKYSTFTYGEAVNTTGAFVAWGVEVDWDNDGAFDGSNEASYMQSINIIRGRVRQLKSTGDGFEQMQTGRLTIELNNSNGRYNGWNTASPLYPNVTYGRDIRVTVRDWATGTTQPVFYGVITDIVPVGYGTDAKVILSADDGFLFLRNVIPLRRIIGGITANAFNPTSAITAVLDAAKWPARWGRNLYASGDTIPYWWLSGIKTAAVEIEDISESYFGHFFIAADGRATFKARTTIDATATDFPQSVILKDVSNPQPWVNNRNIVNIAAHPLTVSDPLQVLYKLATPPLIATGATVTFYGKISYSLASTGQLAAYSIGRFTPGTDWLANTSADGTGTDKTANVSILDYQMGNIMKHTIINNAGVPVYITLLQTIGEALYEISPSKVLNPEDPTVVAQPREFVVDRPWIQDVNYAIDQAGVLSTYFSTLHSYPVIQVEERFSNQFGIDLFDTITVDLSALGVSGQNYRVGGIEHRSLGDNCQAMVTKFYCEPTPYYVAYWTWGTASVFDTDLFGA